MKTGSLFLNKGFMALKFYMMKMHDRVEWGYLQLVLGKMAFPQSLIWRIMRCLLWSVYGF